MGRVSLADKAKMGTKPRDVFVPGSLFQVVPKLGAVSRSSISREGKPMPLERGREGQRGRGSEGKGVREQGSERDDQVKSMGK